MNLFDECAPDPKYCSDPFPYLEQLRNTAPYYFNEQRRAWFVSSYREVAKLLGEPRLDVSATSFADQSPVFRSAVVPRLRAFFAQPDPTPFVELIETVVQGQLQRLLEERRADLAQLSRNVPVGVIGKLLGIPYADLKVLQELASHVLRAYDLSWPGRPALLPKPTAFLDAYFGEHLAAARKGSATSLVSALLEAQREHELSEASIVEALTRMFDAGQLSIAGCIANVLEWALSSSAAAESLSHSFAADPRQTIDELIRLHVPVLASRRLAREPVETTNGTIETGQRVYLLNSCANRDPQVFDEPNSFRPGQARKAHLGFGLGQYYCLGAPLARLEIHAVLTHFLPLLGKIRACGPTSWRQSWLVHEPGALEVILN